MSSEESLSKMESMQRFTATGRPFKAADPTKEGWSMNSMAVADSYGAAQGNLLPVKYTDDSLIPVPVLKPDQMGKALPERKRSFFSRRKSRDDSFTIKHLPRGEYLKHYAKDDNGMYIGTEEPAADCILRGGDLTKYRRATITFHDEVNDSVESRHDEIVR